VLCRHGLGTRQRWLALVAGFAAPPEPQRLEPPPERHLDVSHPGELVQMDCLYVDRLSGTRGVVWQYTAIDVGSAYVWAELDVTPRNPSAHWTSRLAQRVARELAEHGWRVEAVMTDNGQEFRSRAFRDAVGRLGPRTGRSTPDARRPTAASSACKAPSSSETPRSL
jgi:transposase InsO family protein